MVGSVNQIGRIVFDMIIHRIDKRIIVTACQRYEVKRAVSGAGIMFSRTQVDSAGNRKILIRHLVVKVERGTGADREITVGRAGNAAVGSNNRTGIYENRAVVMNIIRQSGSSVVSKGHVAGKVNYTFDHLYAFTLDIIFKGIISRSAEQKAEGIGVHQCINIGKAPLNRHFCSIGIAPTLSEFIKRGISPIVDSHFHTGAVHHLINTGKIESCKHFIDIGIAPTLRPFIKRSIFVGIHNFLSRTKSIIYGNVFLIFYNSVVVDGTAES